MQVQQTDTILSTIKDALHVYSECFDTDLVIHANNAFFTLLQLGVIDKQFQLLTGAETWEDLSYFPDTRLAEIAYYLCIRVRYLFDPPQSGAAHNALKESIAEAEWRMNVFAEEVE